MKELNLSLLINLAKIASTIGSIGTTEARKLSVKILDRIDSEVTGQVTTSTIGHQWSPEEIAQLLDEHREKSNGSGLLVESTSGDVLIAKTRIDYLERVETYLSRLVALIGLHDGSVAINAHAATSALTTEIAELIASYKA